MLHLKVPNVDKGKGPRFAVFQGLAIAEDVKDPSICHVNHFGLNYVVDSTFDDTAKELGIQIGGKTAA